jgi:hypothetical protein
MSKKAAQAGRGASPMLFVDAMKRRHNKLVLPKFLREEAFRSVPDDNPAFQKAKQILRWWADLADKGHLAQKETKLDADFLQKIFGEALGYKAITESPDDYQRQKQFTVPDGTLPLPTRHSPRAALVKRVFAPSVSQAGAKELPAFRPLIRTPRTD